MTAATERCAELAGDALHHADGSHRSTPATTSGRALERHEVALRRHLEQLRNQ